MGGERPYRPESQEAEYACRVSFPRLFAGARNDYECRAPSSAAKRNGRTFGRFEQGGEIKSLDAARPLYLLAVPDRAAELAATQAVRLE